MTQPESGDDPESLDDRIDALEDLREELEAAPVEETRLAELYEEVSNSPPQLWNRATAFIDVEDGQAVVSDVSKLARGWWAPEIVDDCDAMVTIDVHAGLPPENFVTLATAALDEEIEAIREGDVDDRGPPL